MKHDWSLFSRLAFSTVGQATVVIVLAIAFFTYASVKFISYAIHYPLHGYSRSLAEQILASRDPEAWREIARKHRVGLLVETGESRHAFDRFGVAVSSDDLTVAGRTLEVRGRNGERVVLDWNLEHLRGLHDQVLVGYVLLLLAVFGGTYWFQSRQLRPLRWLRTGVEAVARGDFKTKVPVVRRDEIGQVAGAFNRMTRQVERMVEDRERLLADVSHELRSPLARMKVALELLPEGEKRTVLQEDVREMERLISVLLERERLRAQADQLAAAPVDLVALARRVTAGFAGREPGVVFRAAAASLVAEVDADLIRLLLQNLIDNAVKFSPPGAGTVEVSTVEMSTVEVSTVEVSLRRAGESIELLVSDDGPGIAEEDAERIFEPFVKLDPARGHRRGYGLGLDLCRRIVEVHGGSIGMTPGPGRGTCVKVVLPATAAG